MADADKKEFRKIPVLGVNLTELFGRARNTIAQSLFKLTNKPYLRIRNLETKEGREKSFIVQKEQALLNILRKVNGDHKDIDATWKNAAEVRINIANYYGALGPYFVHQTTINDEINGYALSAEKNWLENGTGKEEKWIKIMGVPIKFSIPKERKLFFWVPGFQRINPGQEYNELSIEDIENTDSPEWQSMGEETRRRVFERIKGRIWTENVRYFGKDKNVAEELKNEIFSDTNVEQLQTALQNSEGFGVIRDNTLGLTVNAIIDGVSQAFTEILSQRYSIHQKEGEFYEYLTGIDGKLTSELKSSLKDLYTHSIENLSESRNSGKICFKRTRRICQPFLVDWENSKIKIATLEGNRAGLMKREYGDVAPGLDDFGMPYEVDKEGRIMRDIWENRRPVRIIAGEFNQHLDPLWNSAFNENVFDMYRDQIRDARYNNSTYTINEYAMRLALGPLKEYEPYGWGAIWLAKIPAIGSLFFTNPRLESLARAFSVRPKFRNLLGDLNRSYAIRIYHPANREEVLFRGREVEGRRSPGEKLGNRETSNLSPAFDLRGLPTWEGEGWRFIGKKRYYGTTEDGFTEVDLAEEDNDNHLAFTYEGKLISPRSFVGPTFSTRGTALFFMVYTMAMVKTLKEINETFDDITEELDKDMGAFDIGITYFGGRQRSPLKVSGAHMELEGDTRLAGAHYRPPKNS